MKLESLLLIGWVALVWVNFVVATTYPYGTPVRLQEFLSLPALNLPHDVDALGFAAAWIRHVGVLLFCAVLVAAGVGAGKVARGFARAPQQAGLWLSAAFGIGVYGFWFLGLGLAGVLFHPVVWVSLVPGLVLAVFQHRLPIMRERVRVPTWLRWSAAAVLACWVLNVFNPEPGIDAYVYHLRLPFYYILNHKIYSLWHQDHAHVPQIWELLLTVFPKEWSDTGAQVLSALTAFAAYALLVRWGGGGVAVRAMALVLFSSPLVLGVGTSAYTDLPLMWLGFASFALLAGWGTGSPARRFTAGVLLGLACSLKYAAFPIVAAHAVWLTVEVVRRRKLSWAYPVGCGLLAGFAPWLIWNYCSTGNPLYPFFGTLFPESLAPPMYAQRVSGAVLLRGWGDIARSFWNAYIRSEPFLFLSPWFLAVMPWLLLKKDVRREFRGLGIWLGAYLVVWSGLLADERFALAALPVMVVALSVKGGVALGKFLTVGLLALNLAGVIRQQWTPWERLWTQLGLTPRVSYLRANLAPAPGYWDAAAWINRYTRSADKVLLVSDHKSHYIWRECVHEHVVDFPSRLTTILRRAPDDPERMAVNFRQLGIRWLVYLPARNVSRLRSTPDFFPFTKEEVQAFGRFWQTRAIHRQATGGVSIYEIALKAHPPRPVPDLPGVQDLIFLQVSATRARSGTKAALTELRRFARKYSYVGAIRQALDLTP